MSRHHLSDDQDEVDSHVPLLNDHDHHVPVLRDDARNQSPAVSTLSAQSQELKFLFDPCPAQVDLESESDAHSDYSHVNIRPKPRHADGGYMVRPPPPPYNHRYESLANARTGAAHYGFQQGQAAVPNNVRMWSQPPGSNASLDEVNGAESRRKSWSPRQCASTYQEGYRGARGCYSSNMVDWGDAPPQPPNPPPYESSANYPPPPPIPPPPQSHLLRGASHGYAQYHPGGVPQRQLEGSLQGHLNNGEAEGESLPPRLAPVSGVLSEKLSRNLIRPIAFKPAYAKPHNLCQVCREEVNACCCQGYATSQSQSHPQHSSRPDGPVYQRSPSLRSINTSQMSVFSSFAADSASSNRSTGYNNESVIQSILSDDSPGVNVDQSPTRRLPTASSGVDVLSGTPSPSDSGVGELEAMLKEKETEILLLRQVMDRNERAIFQVYEEQKNRWQHDLREIRNDYETRLRAQQDKAVRLEQMLSHGPYPKQNNVGYYSNVQAEKEALAAQAAPGGVKNTNHHADAYHSEPETGHSSTHTTPKKQLSQSSRSSRSSRSSSIHSGEAEGEVTEEMAMKNTEIMALRAQLRVLQTQLQDKDRALTAVREESASKSEELQLAREQIDRLLTSESCPQESSAVEENSTQTDAMNRNNGWHATDVDGNGEGEEELVDGEDDGDERSAQSAPLLRPATMAASEEAYVLSLERQVDALRGRLQELEAQLETERLQWLEEKNKVIRYQKQLQLNYVQMQRKNTALEAEVEQLTLELERRDLKLTALSGEEESVC